MNYNIKIEIERDLSIYDISDYVFNCSDIPITERNLDFTPIISKFDFNLSIAFTSLVPQKNDFIHIFINNSICFSGAIEDKEYNYENRYYKLTAFSKLNLLSKKKFDRTNLLSLISNTSNLNYYNPNNGTVEVAPGVWVPYSNVALHWVIKKCFECCGLTFDDSEILNKNVINVGPRDTPSYRTYQNLVLDTNMMWAINQSKAFYPEVVDNNAYEGGETTKNKINILDFVSTVFGYFGMLIYPISKTSFKAKIKTDLLEVNKSLLSIYEFSEKKELSNISMIQETGGWCERWKYYAPNNLGFIFEHPDQPRIQFAPAEGTDSYTCSWYSSLLFMIRHPSIAGEIDTSLYPGYMFGMGEYMQTVYDYYYSHLHNVTKEFIRCEILSAFDLNVLEHKIKIKDKCSVLTTVTLVAP